MRVRRSPHVFFYLDDDRSPDVLSLLRGEAPTLARGAQIFALVILTGKLHLVDRDELDVLRSLPAERWVDGHMAGSDSLRTLARKGLVVCDSGDEELTALRERDEALSANEWNPYASLYHFMTQWTGVQVETPDPGEFVREHGPPPSPFSEPQPAPAIALPGTERVGGVFDALSSRRTTRAYDGTVPMTLDQLDGVLRYTFGCRGTARSAADILYVKRTSPSGGGLHPIEVYPIVTNVAGVPAGIYHYGVRDHSLHPLLELTPSDARELATEFMCRQAYFGLAHVSFILTARFYRTHWKYRRHPKAYAGILMDAAHLSQTLYLVSAELGLGAFVTHAINGRDIEQRLGLDGISEGAIAMSGCGIKAPGESPLELRFACEPSA